jgi:hypothetical protein
MSKTCKECEYWESVGHPWGHCYVPIPDWIWELIAENHHRVHAEDRCAEECDCFKEKKKD